MTDINLREVNHSDENLLFNWRNIDELVALSYQQKKVRNQCGDNSKPNPFIPLKCIGLIKPSKITNQNNPY